ncbi:MAG: PEP-CTERM sorting domain-containing protein, partial [Sedimentisphaerales bacterium]|nr:PEP-CTERM sorting domain-containing protein [Sedimentisphaerales bacterium]
SGCGSTGISGKGADQDEALIFDFTEGISASSLQLGLSRYRADRDEPIITATLSSGSQLSFSESSSNWSNAVTNLGYGRITVDVGLLLGGEGIGQNDAVSSLYVKETSDHVYVRSLGYESFLPEPIPEPATVGLLGLGSLALLCTPGKRKKM